MTTTFTPASDAVLAAMAARAAMPSDLRIDAVTRSRIGAGRRFQDDRLARALRDAGPEGLRLGPIAHAIGCDPVSAVEWLQRAVRAGEARQHPEDGELHLADTRYIATTNAAIAQADGGAE